MMSVRRLAIANNIEKFRQYKIQIINSKAQFLVQQKLEYDSDGG